MKTGTKKFVASIVIFFIAIFVLSQCKKDKAAPSEEPAPSTPSPYISFNVPQGWPAPVYNFQNNTLSEKGFVLGRALFYDTRLSSDSSTSCGTCHQQFAAFANGGHALSHGVNNLLGNRNSPGIFNAAWIPLFMWDGGINHIENQPIGPITNPVEMAETLNNVYVKLRRSGTYPAMFKDAFGDTMINTQRMTRAIAQFMGAMVSSNSKYDKVKRGDAGVSFTSAEQNGYTLFQNKCASCHAEPLFTDYSFRNNGLVYNTTLNDSGRAHVTGLATDRNKFKVPSLRNIALTSPYMHDGRFSTLQDCLDHYIAGVQSTQNLDPLLVSGIALTTQEKADLISFLQTLTDNSFITDSRFAEPN